MRDEIVKRSVKVIAGSAVVIAIVVAVVYAVLPILQEPVQEPIFELGEWQIVPKGSVMIEFTCVTNELVEIVLLGPTGEMVGRTYLHTGATESAIMMARPYEVPMAGTYKMVVSYPRYPLERIAEYTFTFSPPDVSIEGVSLDWGYNEFIQEYFVSEIRVELVNRGDLPAQVLVFPDIDGIFGGPAREWCMPGEHALIFDIRTAVWRLTSGDTLIVLVQGSEGEVLIKRLITLSPELRLNAEVESGRNAS